jgi:hypothetical protein
MARAWLQYPFVPEAETPRAEAEGEWNGEYYGSFGGGRNWDDAVTFGFFDGGGGCWYSDTLQMLKPGDRVWVNKPGVGYVWRLRAEAL